MQDARRFFGRPIPCVFLVDDSRIDEICVRREFVWCRVALEQDVTLHTLLSEQFDRASRVRDDELINDTWVDWLAAALCPVTPD